jgi:Tfp pilus assembly protein PilO
LVLKGKKIDTKEITNSPYFITGLLVLVILLVIGGIVFFMIDINNIKAKIVETRIQYQENIREIAVLEELRAQSEKAEAELEMYKGILPDSLGDIYMLEENVVATCQSFDLTVKSVQVNQSPAETQETSFNLAIEGSFYDIHSYMAYMSGLEQMHRFDSISLSRNTADTSIYIANITLVVLSQNGADGIVVSADGSAA